MKAISVRQPWAWAIIHAGKDLENRSPATIARWRSLVGQRIAIHASKTMSLMFWEEAATIMLYDLGIETPEPEDLDRGGVIGFVDVVGILKTSKSKWFEKGQHALALANPTPIRRMLPCNGNSSIFNATNGIERYAGARG